jgi:hypothetical protein
MPVNAETALREPQRERFRSHWIHDEQTPSARPEEPPFFGGVSKDTIVGERTI